MKTINAKCFCFVAVIIGIWAGDVPTTESNEEVTTDTVSDEFTTILRSTYGTHRADTTAVTATTVHAVTTPPPCSENPCSNGGTCKNNTCLCTGEFKGWYCDVPSKCQPSDCVWNNTERCEIEIYQQPKGYESKCICKPSYEGDKCETQNYCHSRPCQHEGGCFLVMNKTKPYRCQCHVGDESLDCMLNEVDHCVKSPPINSTIYRTCVDRIDSAQLICAPGFKGQGCRDAADVSAYCTQYGQNCSDERYCKPLCNVEVCNGTEKCDFTTPAFEVPANDTNSTSCAAEFADGYRHPECLSENMLFDGFDEILNNLEECSPYFNSICTKHFGNGKCSEYCNNTACLWDGGDCISSYQRPLPGGVVIQFRQPPAEGFHKNLSMISRSLINSTVKGHEAYLKVQSKNFTTIGNVTRLLSGVIGKRPFLVDYVTDVFVCPAGQWNTSNKCRSSCDGCDHQGDICAWSTGRCLFGCKLGYHGDACELQCPSNCNGSCSGKGECAECKNGYYGSQCNKKCDTKCVAGKCEMSGMCTCAVGMEWNGTSMSCVCPRGRFGDQCSQQCYNCSDKNCDGTYGACATGCVDGFYGKLCEQTCPAGCKVCDQSGVCSDKSQNDHSHGHADSSRSNTGVIIGLVVALLLVAIILGVACVCWRRRGQSGDYPIMDDDEGNEPQGKAAALVPSVVSGMQPPSPIMGRSHDMIDMDPTEGVVVYDGRASSPGADEKNDTEPRQPADGDSEAEPEVLGKNGVTGTRMTSSVVIEVDNKGRMLSITDAELVISPSMLKHDEEVFTMEDENQQGPTTALNGPAADELSDQPEVDDEQTSTPPHSPLWDIRAPLASEENILSSLGPKQERTGSDDQGDSEKDKSTSSGSSRSSRKSNQSSKSSTSGSDDEPTTEM